MPAVVRMMQSRKRDQENYVDQSRLIGSIMVHGTFCGEIVHAATKYFAPYIRRALQLQRVGIYLERAPPSLLSSFMGLLGNVIVSMLGWLFSEAMNETSQGSCDTYNVRPE